jgi:hypothetical protein
MIFCSAVFDLTDRDHQAKYNELMNLTRNVVGGEFKPTSVIVQEYSGKWVADGRYFVMAQWFQAGSPKRFIPDTPIRPVRVRDAASELNS